MYCSYGHVRLNYNAHCSLGAGVSSLSVGIGACLLVGGLVSLARSSRVSPASSSDAAEPSSTGGSAGQPSNAKGVIASGAGAALIMLGVLSTPPEVMRAEQPAVVKPAPSATSTSATAERQADADEWAKNELWIVKAKDAIKGRLKDARSAEFRHLVVSRAGGVPMVCGEVSSKNSFGGRNGFQRVVSAARPDLTFLEEDVEDMDSVWRKFC